MRNPRDTRHGRALPWLLGAIAVVLAAAAAVWWFGIRSEAEPEAKLRETPVVTDGDDRGVDGTWELSDPQRLGSFVGYRVQEQFAASIASQEATGRTSEVTGRLVIADGEVREAEVRANLAALRSDKDRRDQALRTRGLETDRFPEATFRLTEPIRLPDGRPPGHGRGHRRAHPARRDQDGHHPDGGPLGRTADPGGRTPADRVRRLPDRPAEHRRVRHR
jgi:polyisoprenoid-binding protein YceI